MLKHRTFWFALLIPLLLDLLVVFSECPSGRDIQAGIEECSPDVQKGFCEAEERMEEDEETFSFYLLQNFQTCAAAPVAYGECRSFSIITCATPLASGWLMPLRI